MILALGAGLALEPGQWTECGQPATRMAAYLPMIQVPGAQDGSASYATVYDCAELGTSD